MIGAENDPSKAEYGKQSPRPKDAAHLLTERMDVAHKKIRLFFRGRERGGRSGHRFNSGWAELGGGVERGRSGMVHGRTQRSLGINAMTDGSFMSSLVVRRLESATR